VILTLKRNEGCKKVVSGEMGSQGMTVNIGFSKCLYTLQGAASMGDMAWKDSIPIVREGILRMGSYVGTHTERDSRW